MLLLPIRTFKNWQRTMNIALITSSLSGGGAARILSLMASHWSRAGWRVTLFTLEDSSKPPFYPLAEEVRVRHLAVSRTSTGFLSALANNWRRLVTIRRAVLADRPDALVSFIDTTNILAIFALLGVKVPVVVSERVHPAHEPMGRLWSSLRRLAYPLADCLVVQTRQIARHFKGWGLRRLEIIANPVTALPESGGQCPMLSRPCIVAAGRLSPQKDYALLLRAFARAARSQPDWSLYIAGEGPQREELERQIADLGLQGRARLLGQVQDMGALYAQADASVLSSRYEGFPNALCEAMAAGLPCISTDCPSGPGEILTPGEDGLLVPCGDEDALARALGSLMDDGALRARLGQAARLVSERFSPAAIMAQWELLLRSVLRSATPAGKSGARRDLAIVIDCMGIAGAQRVVSLLANAWHRRGHHVTIFTFEAVDDTTIFPMDPGIELRRLDLVRPARSKFSAMLGILRTVAILRTIFTRHRPDIIISHMGQTNLLCMMACAGTGIPVIGCEHCSPEQAPIGKGWDLLRPYFYRRAALLVALTEGMKTNLLRITPARIRVIPNPVAAPEAPAQTVRPHGARNIVVSAGRLIYQKNFHALIRAFALVAQAHPDWDLVIHGEGEDRASLESLIAELGLCERVLLPGLSTRLSQDFLLADIFVLSSRFEGFPMVLCEAMAAGLPAVAFDCPTGPSDIVRHGVDGLLAPLGDEPGLAHAMESLMGDKAVRLSMAARAGEVSSRFSIEAVSDLWEACFEIVQPKPK